MDRLLPMNIDAEQGLLGSMLMDPQVLALCGDVEVDDFYRDAHRTIWKHAKDLHHERRHADMITLYDRIAEAGKQEEVGGQAYFATLLNSVPTSANARFYADIIREKAARRRLIHAAGQMAALAYNVPEGDMLALQGQSMDLLMQAFAGKADDGVSLAADDVITALATINERMEPEGRKNILKTGFAPLDREIRPIQLGELIYVAARPGRGKSSLGLTLFRLMAQTMRPLKMGIEYLTLEMSKYAQSERLLSAEAHIDSMLLANGMIDEHGWADDRGFSHVSRAAYKLREDLGNNAYFVRRRFTIDQLRSHLANAKLTRNIGAVVLDQMDCIEVSKARDEGDQLSQVSAALKSMVNDLNITVICLVQLNREADRRGGIIESRPRLSDLRWTGRIEQDGHRVWFIHLPSAYVPEHGHPLWSEYCELVRAKERGGKTGITRVRFRPPYTAFEEWPIDEYEFPTLEGKV